MYISNESGNPHIYKKSLVDDSKEKQLTFGDKTINFLFLSPQGDKILYPLEDKGDERHHLYVLTIDDDSSETKKITKIPYVSWGLTWHPNGREITRTFADGKAYGLETFNLDTEESFVLTDMPFSILRVQYSPDGKWLALTGNKNNNICIINRNDPEDQITYSAGEFFNSFNVSDPSWSPNGKWIAFLVHFKHNLQFVAHKFQGENQIIFELNEMENAEPYQPCSWTPDSKKIFYNYTKFSRCMIRGHSLDGKIEDPFPFPPGRIVNPIISKDGENVYIYHSSMTNPGAIYIYRIGTNSYKMITPKNFNPEILNILTKPQSIFYESFDNTTIHGWYIPTPNPKKISKPALIYIHGGPSTQVYDEWAQGVYLQALSQSGFGVLAPNYRGSTGYGTSFYKANIGDVGGGDLEDVVYGAKWLRKRPEVDKNKVGIVGGSYGGFMTIFALVRRPDVFNIGVALVPVVDWIAEHEHLPANNTDKLFGGLPGENEELWKDRSPLTHVRNIKAPLLIKAGVNDSRCPIEPIREFVKILKEINHPHKYIEVPDEGHQAGLVKREERAPDFFELLQFLRKNLK